MRTLSLRRVAAAAITLVCGWVAYAVYAETAAGHSLDSRLSAAQQANDRLRHEIAQRQAEVDEAQTKEWLIEQARKLGYVMPGERVFVLATPGVSLPPDGGIDLKNLPSFSGASPSPGSSPQPSRQPVVGPSPGATPTPFVFVLPTPPGH